MPDTNIDRVKPDIDSSWLAVLTDEFNKQYFKTLKEFLIKEKANYVVYPPGRQIFSAFNHTPFNKLKVVIIGQDPYHGPNQANGLCFSVSDGVRQPPSLKNIFKELNDDLGTPIPTTGNLEPWAEQGILLLNTVLTVRQGEPNSHKKSGWITFTDAVIKKISDEAENIVFILWGANAKAKASLIDSNKHHIISGGHPSFASSHKQFFGRKYFSQTNAILQKLGKEPINWEL